MSRVRSPQKQAPREKDVGTSELLYLGMEEPPWSLLLCGGWGGCQTETHCLPGAWVDSDEFCV